MESPPGAAETPVPQSTDPESLQLCDPGSGMGNGNSWGDCPTGTPIAEEVSLPRAAGGEVFLWGCIPLSMVHRLVLALWGRPYSA